MKKSIFTLAFLCAALAGMTLTSCSKNNGNEDGDTPSYPEAPGLACVKINGIWWAPVNCGYDANDYPYGKSYQWGRHDGCGYNDGSTYTETVIQKVVSGPVAATSEDGKNFYKVSSRPEDWLTPQDGSRWNRGSESSPIKTQYDPCPEGWRVPTYKELNSLAGNSSGGDIGTDGYDDVKKGYWFNGTQKPKVGEGLFLPAAGGHNANSGQAVNRLMEGCYWASSVNVYSGEGVSRFLYFRSYEAFVSNYSRGFGFSVRCVKE